MTFGPISPGTTGFLLLCLLGYGLLVNLLALVAFAIDGGRAKRGEAGLPARSLLLLALMGGWPGAKLGQMLFRRRARKRGFGWMLNLAGLALPLGLAVAMVAHDPAPMQAFGEDLMQKLVPSALESEDKELPRRFGPGSDDDSTKG